MTARPAPVGSAADETVARPRPAPRRREPIRVLELRSACGAGGGPEKTILLGAAQSDPAAFEVTVCYLRDLRDGSFSIGDRARRLGVDYVEIPERHSFDWAVWPALRRLVRERRIDIVHAHEYKTDLLGLLLARAEGIGALATVHGWIHNTQRERMYGAIDLRVLARYPVVVAVSEVIRQTLIGNGARPERVQRLLNGVDHRQFRRSASPMAAVRTKLGLPVDRPVIGSIGRLGPEKRFDLLIEAARRLSLHPCVAIAGDGPCAADLSRAASSSGVDLRLLGHQQDVREVYEALDVFVQTSDTEGIPNAVLEAMALETPVVATAVGGTGEIVADGADGLLVPRRDVEALARAIQRTLDDEEGRTDRVRAARARAETDLAFDARMRKLEAIYQQLAGRGGPRRR